MKPCEGKHETQHVVEPLLVSLYRSMLFMFVKTTCQLYSIAASISKLFVLQLWDRVYAVLLG